MDLELSEAQRGTRDTARRFARERLGPMAPEIDRSGKFPTDAIAELARLGMLGVFIPERFGGAGLDHVAYVLALEELAAESAAVAAVLAAHQSLAAWPILEFGSDSQRERYVPKMASGESLGCLAAGAVNEFASVRRDGGNYVLGGSVRFVTNAPQATVAIVYAHEAREPSVLIVETASAGWAVAETDTRMGLRGACSARVTLTGLRTAGENLLGREGGGFEIARLTIDGARIASAAQAVGVARAALTKSLSYAAQRQTFGAPIAQYQGIQFKLADMAVDIDAARLLTLRGASLRDAGRACGRDASMAKLFAVQAATKAAIEAIQIHGGYGYTKEFAVERYLRDAKTIESCDGATERERILISQQIVESGRGPSEHETTMA